jgi:hypothetical protein
LGQREAVVWELICYLYDAVSAMRIEHTKTLLKPQLLPYTADVGKKDGKLSLQLQAIPNDSVLWNHFITVTCSLKITRNDRAFCFTLVTTLKKV